MITYTVSTQQGFYYLDDHPALEGYQAAFYDPADGGANQLSLEDSWKSAGVYLFLRIAPTDLAAQLDTFMGKLKTFLNEPVNEGLRFLWLENPLAPIYQWRTQQIALQAAIDSVEEHTEYEITRLTAIEFRNYQLVFQGGSILKPSGTGISIGGKSANLETAYGANSIRILPQLISLEGGNAGCIQCIVPILKEQITPGSFGYPDLEKLDVSFRMFMRDPEYPAIGDDFYMSSHRYAFLSESSDLEVANKYYPDEIDFHLNLDPLDLLNELPRTSPQQDIRSYFQFLPLGGEQQYTGIPSAFRTNIGYSVHFQPDLKASEEATRTHRYDQVSRLVFSPKPMTTQADGTTPYYLTPSGNFIMQVPRYQTTPPRDSEGTIDIQEFEDSILCGIAGLEYVKLTPGFTDILYFKPGQPAFVPSYVSTAAMLRQLPEILESFSDRLAPPYDLNVSLTNTEGLALSPDDMQDMQNIFLADFFPEGYSLDRKSSSAYQELQSLEDLIAWLSESLQSIVYSDHTELITDQATTSWAYVRQAEALGHGIYYAQPERSVLYKSGSDSTFLDYMEVPTIGLPDELANDSALLAFPFLPYGEVGADILSDYLELESQLISKIRRNCIQKIGEADQFQTALLLEQTRSTHLPNGTSPQGLLATFSADFTNWQELLLARYIDIELSGVEKDMSFQNIPMGAPLKAALQSNPLMMVISDPSSIQDYFKDENELMIDGWEFFWETAYWQDQGEKPDTLLIFKYQEKSLLELAAQPESWTLGTSFNEDLAKVSTSLLEILEEAVEAANGDDPKTRRKYETLARAATVAGWTGILALNIYVPQKGLPQELKALAAGIDANKFYAQYVGIDVTAVDLEGSGTNAQLSPKPSALFGLIDYKNEAIPAADASGYNFHVPSLSVVFQNSKITDFAAEVLLVMDRLFDEPTQLYQSETGLNILSLKGTAERHNEKVTYSFGFSGANHFLLADSEALSEIEIVKAQFATDPIPDPNANPLAIRGRFSFWGRMKFAYLKGFDALSFGPKPNSPIIPEDPSDQEIGFLSFSNVQVVMSFDLDTEANKVNNKTFEFQAKQLAFDLVRSSARKYSLYEKFPLKLTGLKVVKDNGTALKNSGFMPVKSPLGRGKLGDSWYGLTFDLNLGSLGALTGKAGLVVNMLLAWSPSTTEGGSGIYVGLKLPGSTGGKKEISIQGVLKIVFKSIEMVVYPLDPTVELYKLPDEVEREVGYLLKLKNIVLKFFVLSLPPSGQSEIILFGDPREVDQKDKLVGWYAAYSK